MVDSVKIYNTEYGACSKSGAEGSQYWMQRKLEIEGATTRAQHESLKIGFPHQTLREQDLERNHSERWSNGISCLVRCPYIDDNDIPT